MNSGKYIPSEGPLDSAIVVVSAAPVGERHYTDHLRSVMEAASLDLNKIYFTSLVKLSECDFSTPVLRSWVDPLVYELGIVKPKLLITVGNSATYGLRNIDNVTTLKGVIDHTSPFADTVISIEQPAKHNILELASEIKNAVIKSK